MSNITTDSIVKAIIAARSNDNIVGAIHKVTQGAKVSDNLQDKIRKSLQQKLEGNERGDAIISGIMSILKASEGLPVIMEAAQNLFPKGTVRKGNTYTATRAGIAAWNNGARDNELVAVMSDKCPTVDAQKKAREELISLLNRALDKCAAAGVKDAAPLSKFMEAISK